MRSALTFLLLLACTQASFAQLSGPLGGTLGPGEFYVIDTISVEVGDTLTLLAGTTFNFAGHFPFEIRGTLLAEGTDHGYNAICFTAEPYPNPQGRAGLRFLML